MNFQTFKAKAKNIFADNARKRFIPALTGRRIKAGALALSVHNPAPAKVFLRQAERLFKNYVVYFLLDVSGSMGKGFGSDLFIASQSVHSLSQALIEAGASSVRVFLFSSDVHEVPIEVFRSERELEKFSRCFCGGGTREGEAVNEAREKMKKESARGKIIFSITDGQPENVDYLIRQVKLARKEKITALSIGIQTDTVEIYYGKKFSKKINSIEELYDQASKLISKNLIRA